MAAYSPYRPCYNPLSPYLHAYSPSSTWSWFLPSWLYSPQPSVSVWPWTTLSSPITTTPSPASWTPPTSPHPLPPPIGTIHIHPSLSYNPIDPRNPKIQWDIISPPERAKELSSGKHLLLPLNLSDEAMYATEGGDITDIWIESDNPVLQSWISIWGPIRLRRVPTEPKFTIGDVLDAIREYLCVPLTTAEVTRLFEGDRARFGESIGAVLVKARIMRERDENEWGMRGVWYGGGDGFRRSDVLGSYRRFQGLRAAVQSDGTWKVYLGISYGQVPRYV